MKKPTLAAAFSGIIALCATAGILLQCGLFSGRLDLSVLTYFTLMSNMGCAVYYAFLAIHRRKHDTIPLPALKGMLQLCITVTGVVYHLMLAGRFEMQGTLAVSNALLHQVVPIAVNLNWLIFDRKPSYTWKMPFVWLLAPLCYALFVYISTAMGAVLGPYGHAYPYYFMDPAQVGGIGMLLLIDVVMGVCFLLMGFLFVALDRWIGKKHVTVSAK